MTEKTNGIFNGPKGWKNRASPIASDQDNSSLAAIAGAVESAAEENRAKNAVRVIGYFSLLTEGTHAYDEPATMAIDLIADILHWAQSQKIDPELILARALGHYSEEAGQ